MLELAVWPAPILKKKIAPVIVFDKDELHFLAEQMFTVMYNQRGIGLAAPQVNLDKRMLVMQPGKTPHVIVNPVIVSSSENFVKDSEGCLSFPGFLVDVERPETVNVNYQTIDGQWVNNYHFSGLGARCIQHEIDHLDGITFLRYISKLHRDIITKKMTKRK